MALAYTSHGGFLWAQAFSDTVRTGLRMKIDKYMLYLGQSAVCHEFIYLRTGAERATRIEPGMREDEGAMSISRPMQIVSGQTEPAA